MSPRSLPLAARASLFGALGIFACGEAGNEADVRVRVLPAGVVARVGQSDVARATVAGIASSRQLPPRLALSAAIQDAVLAEAGRARLPQAQSSGLERAALARAQLEVLEREAAARGAPTDEELRGLLSAHWTDLNRPVSVRVTHAVALLPKTGDASAARRVGATLVKELAGVRDVEEFMRTARALSTPEVTVRAERLPFVTADGRGISVERPRVETSQFDAGFARAAHAIAQPGMQSPLVETAFGYHVILLEERLAERRLSLEEGRTFLSAEVQSRRAKTLRQELVQRLRRDVGVEVSRDVDSQMASLAR